MPFVKGKSGNPGGRNNEKPFSDMLRVAINEVDPRTNKRKLRLIAEKLVDEAVKGEAWAINAVADRIEGKPHQTLEATVRNEPTERLSDSELEDHIASIAAQLATIGTTPSQDKSQLN